MLVVFVHFKRQLVDTGHQPGVDPNGDDMVWLCDLEANRNRLRGVVTLNVDVARASVDFLAVDVNLGAAQIRIDQQHDLLAYQ